MEREFASPYFQPNILSNPAGALAGAGLGALKGLQGVYYGWPTAAILTVPIGAVVGALAGSACAVAAMASPTADADFESLLHAADADAWFADLQRALAEIESALAATGRRIAQQLLAQDVLRGECPLQSNGAGEVSGR